MLCVTHANNFKQIGIISVIPVTVLLRKVNNKVLFVSGFLFISGTTLLGSVCQAYNHDVRDGTVNQLSALLTVRSARTTIDLL